VGWSSLQEWGNNEGASTGVLSEMGLVRVGAGRGQTSDPLVWPDPRLQNAEFHKLHSLINQLRRDAPTW
jgi:hypothetical protein